MLKTLKLFLKGTLWVTITGWIGALLMPLALEFRAAISATVINKLSPSSLFLALLGLLLTCFVLGALLYEANRQKKLLTKYSPDPEWPGTYKDSITGQQVCGICLHRGRISPLVTDGPQKGWACGPCKQAIGRRIGGL